MKKAKEGMMGDEAQFSVEMPVEKQSMIWSDKYKPRKPRFFNRVHTVSVALHFIMFKFNNVFLLCKYVSASFRVSSGTSTTRLTTTWTTLHLKSSKATNSTCVQYAEKCIHFTLYTVHIRLSCFRFSTPILLINQRLLLIQS